jgi:hypothetical protein
MNAPFGTDFSTGLRRRCRVGCSLWLIGLAGCSPSTPQRPAFVDRLIVEMRSESVRNPPAAIWRYRYDGNEVYYVPPSCCDVPSELYDQDGNLLCSPDGGLTGRGDGRCPDFFDQRSEETQIWRDER